MQFLPTRLSSVELKKLNAMEEIKSENELMVCEMKKENLRNTMEKIKSQANDILCFSLQWCDLEDNLKNVKEKIEKRSREVVLKERELEDRSFALEERAKVVAAAESEVSGLEINVVGFRREIEEKSEELDFLRKSLEECSVQYRSKNDQLNELEEALKKTQIGSDLKVEQLRQVETDLEKNRSELSAEMEHLGRTQTWSRELEVEIERKRKDLTLVLDKIAECEKLFAARSLELVKSQGEVELKGKELEQINIDLESHRGEVRAEMERLDKSQTHSRELEVEIERKRKDLTVALDKTAECEKQLKLVEKQLDSRLKLLETQSSEIISKVKTLEGLNLDLYLKEKKVNSLDHMMKETCEHIESKAMELKEIEMQIQEQGDHNKSMRLRLEEHQQELASKEKKHNEMTEAIRKLSLEIVSKEKILERAKAFSQQLSEGEKKHNEMTEAIHKLSLEIVSKEKTLERAETFSQQLSEKEHSKQKKLDLIERLLQKSAAELASKEEKFHSVNDTYRECLQDCESKNRELKSLQEEIKKTQDSLNDLQSKEKKQVRVKASLVEHEQEFEIKKKQFKALSKKIELKEKELHAVEKSIDKKNKLLNSTENKLANCVKDYELKEKKFNAHSEKIELKEKELHAWEERISKKDQLLKSTEKKLANCVKDYELKAKKLSRFCQQSNLDQHVDLVRDANVHDEKTLQLLLHGHLKKCPQLYLDISHALKASSDPSRLVLDTIRGLHHRMLGTQLDPNSIRRNSICLLECLMDMSPKANTDVQGEAIKSAIEWKNTTLIKAENPVEVLGFLHFLGAFSLAYTFDTDKVHNLFDVSFLHKFTPSLCEALGISSLIRVNKEQSSDDKPEQQPPEAPVSNSSDSCCLDVQENIASPHLVDEDAILDVKGSYSFLPNEVFAGLQGMIDPGKFVLDSIKDALVDAQQRGELCLAEPMLNTLIALLEELPRVLRPNNHLLLYASEVAIRWRKMMGTSAQISPLHAWGFLQLLVAYGLVQQNDRDRVLLLATYVTHFKQAPKLFQALGLGLYIPNIVNQLLNARHCILAIRFILFFKLNHSFSPLEYLKEEIMNLRLSAKKCGKFKSQAEDRDAGKMRDILELIVDFELEIDLPVDLIVNFMVPRETQNHNRFLVSSSVPIQPPLIHTSYIATHGTNLSNPTSLGASPTVPVQPPLIHTSYITSHGTYLSNPTSLAASPNQASGSTLLQAQSSQKGFKRPRVDSLCPRPAIRPCFNPSSSNRF